MALWELAAAVDGYNRAHASEEQVDAPSADEFEMLKRAHGDD